MASNKTVKSIMAINTPTLGTCQLVLEEASKELKAAQEAFEKAGLRLYAAENSYTAAVVSLTKAVEDLRVSTKILPIQAK